MIKETWKFYIEKSAKLIFKIRKTILEHSKPRAKLDV